MRRIVLSILLFLVSLGATSCTLVESDPAARAALMRKGVVQMALYPAGNAPGLGFADMSCEGSSATEGGGGGGIAGCPT